MIRMWLLVIQMSRGYTEHGYFLERDNCIKTGKQLVGDSRYMKFECKSRRIKMK